MSTQQVVNELHATVGSFASSVEVKMNNVDKLTQEIKQTAAKTYNEIKQFKQSMIENEQMQSAQENILRINQIIRERFSDYDDIRKTVMGVVKDFDINLVRNKTIQELSEELWITSSRYWLSYTLIAISAWVNNNESITKNALSESFRVNQIKTSLFFCLMNLRFNRIDTARNWLIEYFATIIPEDIQNETAILLQSYINGVFGVDKQLEYTVKEVVDTWVNEINIKEEASTALIKMYENYLKKLNHGPMFKCEYIAKYCTNAAELPPAYFEATKYDALINSIEEIDVENIIQNASNFKARIDAILKDLITNYDEEEMELKNEQEYFQLIIDNKGKEEVALTQYSELMEQRNQKQNIGQKCIEWALYDKEINVHVRKFGYQNTKTWYLEALSNWSSEFEEKFPENYNITIEDWSCVSNGDDAEEQEISLKEHLEKNKFKIKYVNKTNIWMILLTLFFTAFGICSLTVLKTWWENIYSNLPMIMGLAVGIGGAAIFLIVLIIRMATASSKFKKKVNSLLSKLNGTMTEIAEYRKTYLENKDKKAKIYSLIEHL